MISKRMQERVQKLYWLSMTVKMELAAGTIEALRAPIVPRPMASGREEVRILVAGRRALLLVTSR